MKKLKTLLQSYKQQLLFYYNRATASMTPVEKSMLVDALIAVSVSLYLISPIPILIIQHVSPAISVPLVVLIPILLIMYLYRRMKYYVSVFSPKKQENKK